MLSVVVAGLAGGVTAAAQAPVARELSILAARLDHADRTITIDGTNFQQVLVTFNGWPLDQLPSSQAGQVVAQLPPGFDPDSSPGSYRVMVLALDKKGQPRLDAGSFDRFDLTIGAAGAQGPVGPTGVTGLRGEAGPQGPSGPQGVPGLAGPTGPQGPAGDAGRVGPDGSAGPAGAQGVAGVSGLPGPAGPMGPQGPEGNPGPAGTVTNCRSVNIWQIFDRAGWASCPADSPAMQGLWKNNNNWLYGIEEIRCCQLGPGF